MKRTAALLVLLCAVDWALTADGLALGLCSETNPLMAAMFQAGMVTALFVKLALTIAGTAALVVARAERALSFCLGVYCVLTLYHVAARLVLL